MNVAVYYKCGSWLTYATLQGQERKQQSALHGIAVGEPFACISLDLKAMDESFDDNRYTLVFQDYLTKWLEVYPVSDHTSSTVAKILTNLI